MLFTSFNFNDTPGNLFPVSIQLFNIQYLHNKLNIVNLIDIYCTLYYRTLYSYLC